MSEKILFVDDDPNLLAGVERNLRKQFQLDTADGGKAGLEKIRSFPSRCLKESLYTRAIVGKGIA